MPKQFKNSKKILAATVLTTALSIAPVVSNADTNQTAEPGFGPLGPVTPTVEPAEPELPAVYDDEHGNKVYDYSESDLNPDAGQPAEPGEGYGSSTPSVDENGNSLDPNAGQPAEPGEGP